MMVKAPHTTATFLAVVRPRLPGDAAYNADLLEIALLEKLKVLALTLLQECSDPFMAEVRSCLLHTAAQLERGIV
jgi:hypothetical protein